MTPDKLRQAYLDFFRSLDHRVVPSSRVIPEGDPTLLFTNAGMNQFKDVLLGRETRDYVRATSVQKCIRAGGKHNDLDEVGKDGRHLTFFEMLGNWSFGDYFKVKSIEWAWEFVTDTLELEEERLYVSVYKDDDEAWNIWHDVVGLPPEKLVRLGDIEQGDDENFWSMGPTGPCGPSSEIYYDHHPEHGDVPWEPGFDEERFVELWNLVFMSYDRDDSGEMTPLPIQSVDTGMGLDRVASVLAGVDNVFQSGLFDNILTTIDNLRFTNQKRSVSDIYNCDEFTTYCVIADHIRTLTFSVCDGGTFSNEGRGYVLRRILRRAVRHGRQLGFEQPFLCKLLKAVSTSFGDVYPELRLKGQEAATVIEQEEQRFFSTIDRGIALFEEVADNLKEEGIKEVPGETAFKLYDTFGFPLDLTVIMAEERELSVDVDGYETAMEQQRQRSRSADERYVESGEWITLKEGTADTFVGYELTSHQTQILRYRISKDDSGSFVELCLDETPFYAEAGGQVGDTGTIKTSDGQLVFQVFDTKKTPAGITHFARIKEGTPESSANQTVMATVDAQRREKIKANHTATHLLHAALHNIVSDQAFQAGSLVDSDRLRFDFNYDKPLTEEQLQAIEQQVNKHIAQHIPLDIHSTIPLKEAEDMGAMMIFGEKYGEYVRVVEVPNTSTELCGGIHVEQTGDISYFRIVSETGVAAGVRRIEALTGEQAFHQVEKERNTLKNIAHLLKTNPENVERKVRKLLDENKKSQQMISSLQAQKAGEQSADLLASAEDIHGLQVIASSADVADRDALLAMADQIRDRAQSPTVALLLAAIDGKPALLVVATQSAIEKFNVHAGKLINVAAEAVGGRGGGRPDLAQGGGDNVDNLNQAMDAFKTTLTKELTE